MTRIKICGITNIEDALAAVDYGTTALGFIFVPNTPRFVSDEQQTAALLDQIPPLIARVGVCKDPWQIPESLLLKLTTVQCYSSDWKFAADGPDLILACPIKSYVNLKELDDQIHKLKPTALLLDTYHKDKLGGSGETFNWDMALEVKERFGLPIILAGGLTADNVEEAIAKVNPYAVDVSSGVEAEPGRKDHAKLRDFIRAVRRADALLGRLL